MSAAGARGEPIKQHLQNWRDIFYTSRDGLRLYSRHYPEASASCRRPVVCIAGLTRNARDFHALASYLSDPANPQARDVYAVDLRGRGRSARDPNWRNYNVQVEMLDVLDLMTVAGLQKPAIVGTSRGGLIAMLMATARPASIGAVVLNDIGPVIERDGLTRIVAYTGRVPLPASWREAASLVESMNKRTFPAVRANDWALVARDWFDDVNGRPAHSYDQNLAKTMSLLDGPAATFWPQFEALSYLPTLAIRGELSDVLSDRTLHEMRVRHPRLEALVVPGQGHAPLLREPETYRAIADFLAAADG
ncbi:MAG: alpha/beta hydrolase [Sphingomonadales bacterium]|nr:alpha/beta hydrolase [Sphingomonadales bacterium]